MLSRHHQLSHLQSSLSKDFRIIQQIARWQRTAIVRTSPTAWGTAKADRTPRPLQNMASVENDAFAPRPSQQPEPVPATRTKQALVFRVGDRCHYSGAEGAIAVTCRGKELEVLDTRVNEQGEQEAEVKAPRWCTNHWILSRHLKRVRQ